MYVERIRVINNWQPKQAERPECAMFGTTEHKQAQGDNPAISTL